MTRLILQLILRLWSVPLLQLKFRTKKIELQAQCESWLGYEAANYSGYTRPHLSTILFHIKLVDWLALRDKRDFAANSKAVVNSFFTPKMLDKSFLKLDFP